MKSILIVSNQDDFSTNEVVEWIRYLKCDLIRINSSDIIFIDKIEFIKNNFVFSFRINGGPLISSNRIGSFWYRRGDFQLNQPIVRANNTSLEDLINESLKNENLSIRDLIYYLIENKVPCISSIYTRDNNKLIHLQIASLVGLKTPNSKVLTRKKDVKKFLLNNPNGIVVKPLSEGVVFMKKNQLYNKNTFYVQYVNEFNKDDLKNTPTHFFPTLLQERILKKFEIRVFVLKKKIYSMAIFSQNDDKTKIDFRRYNTEDPNYRVPYNLPEQIKLKIIHFMKRANLNSGSIDLIYGLDGQFYFLEINPIGQFGMVSHPCNYKLEKQIANELISKCK